MRPLRALIRPLRALIRPSRALTRLLKALIRPLKAVCLASGDSTFAQTSSHEVAAGSWVDDCSGHVAYACGCASWQKCLGALVLPLRMAQLPLRGAEERP